MTAEELNAKYNDVIYRLSIQKRSMDALVRDIGNLNEYILETNTLIQELSAEIRKRGGPT